MANALPLVALIVAGCAALASATTYYVGDGLGWSLNGVYYKNWTSGKCFAVGDKLVFNYVYKEHTVMEVNCTSAYDTCNVSSKACYKSYDNSGWTTVTLSKPGLNYFICNISDHCRSGMNMTVTVSDAPFAASAATPQVPAAAMATAVAAAAGAAIKLALF